MAPIGTAVVVEGEAADGVADADADVDVDADVGVAVVVVEYFAIA